MSIHLISPPSPQDPGNEAEVERLLSHPLVLISAWRRVTSWYKAGEWSPEADLARWNIDTETHLLRLGEKLASGAYQPAPFRRIPYPKKGGQIRHYTLPSVVDQVAFAVFGVLLAPFFEAWMPNFSFGNRWYRPLYRKPLDRAVEGPLPVRQSAEASERSVWAQRAFSLSDRRMYQPYPRAYGMFRRVAHWAAAAMLDVEDKVDTLATERPKKVLDYEEGELPRFVRRKEWWGGQATKRGYSVHLDLQLAYPSMRRKFLRKIIDQLCAVEPDGCPPLPEFGVNGKPNLAGYPREISQSLSVPGVTKCLVTRLLDHLDRVEYVDLDSRGQECNDALWIPPHAHPTLPRSGREPDGLPTGLAISGLLMNVYLSGFDLGIGRWLADHKEGRLAFLRFADDMILLAPEPDLLLVGIDQIWENLCLPPLCEEAGQRETFLARPEDSEGTTNLRVSWAKVEPSSVSGLLEGYLADHKWEKCAGCERHCEPPPGQRRAQHLGNWFQGKTTEDREKLLSALRRDALRPDRLEPFVTFLVESLSGLGSDSLMDRFGQSASHRLTQLHELVRLDIADKQVREDTRLAFAVNRLVRAWIAEDDPMEGTRQLLQIRRSVEIALSKAPWKFSLWRAAVQAAARRPLPGLRPQKEQPDADDEARSWLRKLLQTIAYHNTDYARSDEGLDLEWSEEDGLERCWEKHTHTDLAQVEHGKVVSCRRELMLSALRTSFWRALAGIIREVAALNVKLSPDDEDERPDAWSSGSWTFRAFAEKQIPEVLAMLTSVGDWVEILYPQESSQEFAELLSEWWWEREALAQAALACTPRTSLLSGIARPACPGTWLMPGESASYPLSAIDEEALSCFPPVAGALDLLRRARPVEGVDDSSLEMAPWLHLLLARRTGEEAEERAIAAAIMERCSGPDPEGLPFGTLGSQLALARAFWVEARLPPDFCRSLWRICDCVLEALVHEGLAMPRYRLLRIYDGARHLALSLPSKPPTEFLRKQVTIHGVLWADPRKTVARSWPEPAVMPAVGLPTRVAIAMLERALAGLGNTLKDSPQGNFGDLPDLPIWHFSANASTIFRAGRAHQLGLREKTPDEPTALKGGWFKVKHGRRQWEVPAHAAFYLPWILGWIGSGVVLDLWSHILLFQMAVSGTERSLDAILDYGIGSVPLKERWGLRSRVPVPEEVWTELDDLMRVFGFQTGDSWDDQQQICAAAVDQIKSCLALLLKPRVSGNDFLWERIDVRLELSNSFEVPYSVSPFTGQPKGDLPFQERLELVGDDLAKSFTVRLGQIRRGPDWKELPKRLPGLSRAEIQRIMKEVAEVLGPDSDAEDTDDSENEGGPLAGPVSKPSIVVLPEVAIPRSEIRSLVRVASQQEVTIFAGLLWRVVPSSTRPHELAKGKRWIANEALLVVPLKIQSDSGPPIARQFFVEKPIPADIEHALAMHLSDLSGEDWQVLAGRRWYRFVHPSWGDFTVAICSDLIDSSPWAALRGEMLHLLMCAHNQDVGLYESLTWTRAYENYVNVVAVNSGEYGGSMAWSPKRRGKNEIARLLGSDLAVTADVSLVVRKLWERQFEDQREEARKKHLEFWRTGKEGGDDEFKSPPPGFPYRKKRKT